VNETSPFHWTETASLVAGLLGVPSRAELAALSAAERGRLAVSANGKRLELMEDGEVVVALTPPPVQPIEPGTLHGADYLANLPPDLPRELVLLHQAGASALGLWVNDELVAHKVIKKYVVRGKGRAQPTHLKTRGKSRYGSRLRLRNAQTLWSETNEKMLEWAEEIGHPDRVFMSIPVRTLPELFAADPPPPFDKETGGPTFWNKVPLDVKVPSFAELKRVRWALTHGTLVRRG
jgi:hypothetical protein